MLSLPAPVIWRDQRSALIVRIRTLGVVQSIIAIGARTAAVDVVAALLETLLDVPFAAADDAVVRHLRRRNACAADQRKNDRTCTNDVLHSEHSPFFLSSPVLGQRRIAGEVRKNARVPA